MIVRHTLLPFALLALGSSSLLQAQKTPIQITADLSDAPRKLYHAEVDIPVTAGPVTLTTPKWIPGNHRPTGPVDDITGVVFTANGKVLPWRRDDEDLYQFHVTVPAGVTILHAHLDCIVIARIIGTSPQLFRRPRTEDGTRGTEAGPTALGVALIVVLCSAYRSRSATSWALIISATRLCSSRTSCIISGVAGTGYAGGSAA